MMRIALAVVAAVAVLVAGGLVVWRFLGHDDEVVRIDAAAGGTVETDGLVVRFAPAALTADTDVRVTPLKDVPPPEGTAWVSEPVDVTLKGGGLRTAATLTMPLKDGVAADDPSVTIVSRTGDGAWTAEGGAIDPAAGTVTTIVGHFTDFATLKRLGGSLKDIVEAPVKIGGTLVSSFRDAAYEAPEPRCDPVSQVWAARTKGDNVKVCTSAGAADRPSRLRIVNNRLYGQFLQMRAYPALKIEQNRSAKLVTDIWRALAEVNPDYTYLDGKETADIDLAGGYRSIDFVARPSLEAVIMKVIVDTAGVAMTEAKVVVQAIQCVLTKPVFGEVVRKHAYRRIPELGAAIGNCISAAVGTWTVLGKDASPDEQAKAKKLRSAYLDAWSTAMKDFPLVFETIVQGGFIQRWNTQHVIADRTAIQPQRALNEPGGTLPAAVAATQKKLYDAAAGYKVDRYGLDDELPRAGLMFGNAADQGQKQSVTPGLEADQLAGPGAAAAIVQLTSTPPLRWKCPETGRDSYVYGFADPELDTYPGRLTDLGYNVEETSVIRESARAGRPYRLCIEPKGTWTALSRNMPQQWPSVDALRIEERSTTYTECSKVLVSAYMPPDAYCPTSIRADVDGDGKKDALIVYRRPGKGWTARAVMAAGPVADMALPVAEDAYPPVNSVVIAHTDMDGVPGEEAAISVGIGAHSEELVLLTYTSKGFAFVRLGGNVENADRFTIDSSAAYGVGISCADEDRDGKPELVLGSVVFDNDPMTGDMESASGGTTTFTWRDKTLIRKSEGKRTFRPQDRDVYSKPPYQGFACSWR